ncbi:hypothetical protein CSKR_201856 [Clonorchis sinensis]|nr:hypothetical protein CSKR_201856 [Clonorchis sinensis]
MMVAKLLCVFVSLLHVCSAIERSRGALGPRVFTFVHGDDSAKLDFMTADSYCRTRVGTERAPSKPVGIIEHEDEVFGKTRHSSFSNETNSDDLILETRLASLHSYPETLALVKWISKQEKHSFWIGGTVTKTLNEYLRPIFILQWTDGSRGDFSFLKLPSEELSEIRVGEQRCVSVDYLSGQWGLHPCEEKRYFVCLTVPVLRNKVRHTLPTNIPSPAKQPSWVAPRPVLRSPPPRNQLTAEELRRLLS